MTAQSTQTAAMGATALTEAVASHGALLTVPLNRLKASPRNARKTPHAAATIEALAASIAAKGVLQAPVVEVERDGEGSETGSYLVTIGEGRRQALRLLAKRKAIKRTHPVRVVVDADNDAHEISLDENMTREAMHPADQFEAFQRLAVEKGYGPEEIEARLLNELSSGAMRTPVSLIVHSLHDVNWKLEHGRSFFIDIVRDGIVLKDTPDAPFVPYEPLEPATKLAEAEEYFDDWTESVAEFLKTAEFTQSQGFTKKTAFLLHQATETLYQGLLLVLTLYVPRAHNLVRLRKMTEPLVPRLTEVWPHETKFQKRCFELLRSAYVKSRYSRHYKITDEELAYLTERVELLREVVREACEARLEALRAEAAS